MYPFFTVFCQAFLPGKARILSGKSQGIRLPDCVATLSSSAGERPGAWLVSYRAQRGNFREVCWFCRALLVEALEYSSPWRNKDLHPKISVALLLRSAVWTRALAIHCAHREASLLPALLLFQAALLSWAATIPCRPALRCAAATPCGAYLPSLPHPPLTVWRSAE